MIPMRRTRSGSCALIAIGHATTAPPNSVMNSRRCMCPHEAKTGHRIASNEQTGRGGLREAMSALGQERRFGESAAYPLCPQKQTSDFAIRKSASGQKRTHASQRRVSLFDYVIGNGKNAWRNGKSKRFCGLQIDHKLEFGGLHHRQAGRAFTPYNSADVDPRLAILVSEIRSVTHQSAGQDVFAPWVTASDPIFCRKFDNSVA